jgi:hypothetical protein
MKRIAALVFLCFLCVLVTLPATMRAVAQVPAPPTPTPDPHTYTDTAMKFTAPPQAYLAGRRYPSLDDLSDEQPTTVAVWVIDPGKENARTISIAMVSFTGPPSQWEGQFESQLHSSQDGVLIRNKQAMTLTNGMPAYFVEVTTGSGFTTRKQFAVVWADGQRGIVLSEQGRIDDVTETEAKNFLKDASAVRYPIDQP